LEQRDLEDEEESRKSGEVVFGLQFVVEVLGEVFLEKDQFLLLE
jgi:hypothetical protein